MTCLRAGNWLLQFVCALPLLGALAACSGNDGGTPSTTVPPTGTVSGQVVSAANGSAVAGIRDYDCWIYHVSRKRQFRRCGRCR